jgi:hypothetical protein
MVPGEGRRAEKDLATVAATSMETVVIAVLPTPAKK